MIYPLTFTTASGAPRTIISKRVFAQLRPESRPMLKKPACLMIAADAPITDACQARLKLQLGPVTMTEVVIASEIEDDAFLYYDILRGKQGRPADSRHLVKREQDCSRWERNTCFSGR
ncbi:hypothetical protein DPMN_081811 [Dreissena polymorpha]|uniref:Uncharacterized protein n=1 Tax=Dreissena polymorpha TaxID=45954 RepID=A0A9D4B9J5_DREPO|nr:hypothetical protein DPMN_081811 [Dreissena polymorpha]